MIQFTKTAMVSVLALGLITACGQNAAQDWQTQSDNVVVQPDQLDTTANELAMEAAQESQNSPSFVTATARDGSVLGAIYPQRIMTDTQAIQLVQNGQLQFRPIQQIIQQSQNDLEFNLRVVNTTGNQQVQQTQVRQGRRVRGRRYVQVDNNAPLTRRQLRRLVNQQILRSTATSSFFTVTYVSVPMLLQYAYVAPTIQFIQPTILTQVYDTCVNQFSAFAVGTSCYQPFSVSTQTAWQLQVSCNVPLTTTTTTTTTTVQTSGVALQDDSYIQVFL